MMSKKEAEEKLLKIFYDVKLDSYFNLYPTSANIVEFGETKDPDEFDDYFGIKEDELQIGMWANSYEHGVPYFAVIMAHDSAKHWRKDPLYKHMRLYIYTNLFFPLVILGLAMVINSYSLFGAIFINTLGTGPFIYLIILKNKWKNRVLIRFRELFENTGIYLTEEKIKKYSKSRFPDITAITALQCFEFILLLFSWLFLLPSLKK